MRKLKIANFDSFFKEPEKLLTSEEKQKQIKDSETKAEKEKKIREWLTPLFFEITGWHPEEVATLSINEMLEEIKEYIK